MDNSWKKEHKDGLSVRIWVGSTIVGEFESSFTSTTTKSKGATTATSQRELVSDGDNKGMRVGPQL